MTLATIRRRGYTLVLVIVLTGAVGVTLALLARHVVGMTRQARYAALDVHAAQMLADGRAWVAMHRAECEALPPGASIEPATGALATSAISANLTISKSASRRIIIRAIVRSGRFSATASSHVELRERD